jgi:hypothetical protein
MNTLFVSPTAGPLQNGSSADPFATLAQAIADVPYGQGATYTIQMAQGTYANTGSLELDFGDNGLTIDGTLSILSAASAVTTILNISDAYNIKINGLTFQGEVAGAPNESGAVVISAGGNNTLTSDGFRNDGIGLVEAGNGDVIGGPTAGDGDLFRNITNQAIIIPYASDLLIQKVNVDGITDEGPAIEIESGTSITITDADITNVAGNGIVVDQIGGYEVPNLDGLTVSDSIFSNVGTAGASFGDFYVIGDGYATNSGTLDFIDNYVTQTATNDRAVILSDAVGAVITGNTFDIANGATSWLSETGGSLDVTSPNTVIG